MTYQLLLGDVAVPAGNQIANSAAATSFAAALQWPANLDSANNQNRTFRIKAFGSLSTLVTTPGTLTLKLLWGATALAATIAVQLPAAALTNAGWMLDAVIRVCITGTSGKVATQGMLIIDNAGLAITAALVNAGTGATGQITVNTQTAQNIALQSQFSIANAANVITLLEMMVEEVG